MAFRYRNKQYWIRFVRRYFEARVRQYFTDPNLEPRTPDRFEYNNSVTQTVAEAADENDLYLQLIHHVIDAVLVRLRAFDDTWQHLADQFPQNDQALERAYTVILQAFPGTMDPATHPDDLQGFVRDELFNLIMPDLQPRAQEFLMHAIRVAAANTVPWNWQGLNEPGLPLAHTLFHTVLQASIVEFPWLVGIDPDDPRLAGAEETRQADEELLRWDADPETLGDWEPRPMRQWRVLRYAQRTFGMGGPVEAPVPGVEEPRPREFRSLLERGYNERMQRLAREAIEAQGQRLEELRRERDARRERAAAAERERQERDAVRAAIARHQGRALRDDEPYELPDTLRTILRTRRMRDPEELLGYDEAQRNPEINDVNDLLEEMIGRLPRVTQDAAGAVQGGILDGMMYLAAVAASLVHNSPEMYPAGTPVEDREAFVRSVALRLWKRVEFVGERRGAANLPRLRDVEVMRRAFERTVREFPVPLLRTATEYPDPVQEPGGQAMVFRHVNDDEYQSFFDGMEAQQAREFVAERFERWTGEMTDVGLLPDEDPGAPAAGPAPAAPRARRPRYPRPPGLEYVGQEAAPAQAAPRAPPVIDISSDDDDEDDDDEEEAEEAEEEDFENDEEDV